MPSRRRRYRARPKPQPKRPPANDEIRFPEVRLIGPAGEQYGVVTIEDARQRAAEGEMDLVVVAQKVMPPVVRLMDMGKYLYDLRKKQAKQKAQSKGGDVKGVRISFKIGAHDQEIRLRQAEGFLDEGNKVKVEMRLRGREKGRTEMARQKIREFITLIPGGAELEGTISATFNSLSAVVTRPRAVKAEAEN